MTPASSRPISAAAHRPVRTALLAVEHLVAGYAPNNPILRGVSMVAAPGEIVAILGPNGAGTSTLIKSIAGLVPVSGGRIEFEGQAITALPTHGLMRMGLAFVPQTDNVFATLSITDNLELAARPLPAASRRTRIADLIALFPDLARQPRRLAGRLSGGQRQMLAIARALAVSPRLLLLDEPSAGLAPKVVTEVFDRLTRIRSAGVTVVLVEQNVRAALAIADRLYVLAAGRNGLEGPTAELAAHPALAAMLSFGMRVPTAATARP